MPYPRPVSPLGLETCSPPASEIDPDDLLGSDDELDDAARAAKRQRIERLAESYLRGRPLFIFSASLRGPFDQNWVNPWKKTRKSRRSAATGSNQEIRDGEHVVQETDWRHPRHREGFFSDSRRSEVPASSAVLPTASTRDSSRVPEDQPFAVQRTVDWLRKDQNQTDFKKFDPPSSPTTTIASRQPENKAHPPAVVVPCQLPSTKSSPCQRVLPNVGSSFRAASSSAQLPRFEYCRRKEKTPLKSAVSPNTENTEQLDTSPGPSTSQALAMLKPWAAGSAQGNPATSRSSQKRKRGEGAEETEGHIEDHDDDAEDWTPDTAAQANTGDRLPSAQEVMALIPSVSDRVTSLHSTALPKEYAEKNAEKRPETQLSTQAALLHAQKSLQNDLESPDCNEATTGRANCTSEDRLEQSVKTSRATLQDQMQAMSTQYMIDAASPYTFSTAKKTNMQQSNTPKTATRTKKQKTTSFAVSPSPEDSEDDYQNAQYTAAMSPRLTTRQSNNPSTLRSGTQATTLPLELSASTPATAQDGQGALQGVDSFDLSQAIADAGSWLQHSIDFMRRVSQNSESDASRPALDVG